MSGSARRRVPLALVPVAIWFVAVLVLGVCKVSGSSIAAYGESNRPTAGQVRPVRGDEYLQRTPLVLRQAAQGFPSSTELGMGDHDTGILADLPTSRWTAVLRPQTIGYAFFDVERAFALEWWLVLSAPFVAVYALVVLLTRRVLVATLAGLATAVAPAALWWAIPAMGMSVGFAVGAAAFVVAAGRARSRTGVFAASVAAGWALAGLAAVLYFPWTVPLALLALPLGLIGWRHERRTDDRSGEASARPHPLWSWLPGAAVFAALIAGFLVEHRVAIQSVQSTVYPGERRSSAGGIDLRLLLAAPFDAFAGSRSVASVDGINQSEVAAGVALWLPVMLAHGTLWSWRHSRDHVARSAWWAMTACTIMLAWAVLPVPDLLGRLTLLDRVPPERLLLPLSVAGAVVAALFVSAVGRADDVAATPSVRTRAITMTAALTAWAGAATTIDGNPISRWWVLVLCVAIAAVAWALLSGRGSAALAAVVVLTGFSTLRINPVQVGLGPILDSPLMAQIDEVSNGEPAAATDGTDRRWVLNGNDPDGYGILAASGVPLLSGLSLYPDEDTWEIVDPADAEADVWNRYGRVNVYLTPDDQAPVLGAPYPDVIEMSIGACNVALLELQVTVVVSPTPIDTPCLQPIGAPPDAADEFWFYTTVAS